MVLMKQ